MAALGHFQPVAIVTGEGPLRVDLGSFWQSMAQFRYRAISGTFSISNFSRDKFSVRPEAD